MSFNILNHKLVKRININSATIVNHIINIEHVHSCQEFVTFSIINLDYLVFQ